MDKLEDYIRKNRNALDRYTPAPGIWRVIKSRIKGEKSQLGKWLSIAAMVVVIIGSAVLFTRPDNWWPGKGNEISDDERPVQNIPQLKETEIYYNNLVNSLYREATPLLTANPEIEKELSADILQLDSIYSDIKKDLKDNVANQEVVEALIQNYRIKIRLLEDMLAILKENEDNKEKPANYEL